MWAVGAGLAGIDTAYRVSNEVPHFSYAVLEQRAEMGGTWDLFKYPGIRSDSDIFSLSYPFLPWTGTNRLASGPEIKAYIEQAAAKFGIDKNISFNTKVGTVDFDSRTDLWTVTAERDGEQAGTGQCQHLGQEESSEDGTARDHAYQYAHICAIAHICVTRWCPPAPTPGRYPRRSSGPTAPDTPCASARSAA